MAFPLPLAAGEWLEALLPFLFLLFWIVSQIRNFFRAANPGVPPGPVVARPGPRPPAAEDARGDLSRQLEEFLRRSQAGNAAPDRRRAAASPPPPPGRRSTRQAGRESRGGRPAAPSPAPVAAPAGPLGSLGGHGGDVARHVGDAFAHEIRHLDSRVGAHETAPAVAAAGPVIDLATLVRDPATLRQLVLVREVLERPVDRW